MKRIIFSICIIVFGISGIAFGEEIDSLTQRKDMVELQIKDRGITDEKVLDAMLKLPRHLFIPEGLRTLAYRDHPLPIGEGQTISQPYIVALMTELGSVNEDDRVLEIGTGSGYQAAILGEIAREVFTIEIIPELARRARFLLKELGYENIKVKEGDGYLGWPEYAPFDVIIVTAAPLDVPQELVEELSEGGRLVIPVGKAHNQVLKLLKKESGEIIEKNVIPVRFVPMVHEDKTSLFR